MLLNNEIKITVTNDEESNNVALTLNFKDTFNDVMTCIELAKNTLTTALARHFEDKGGVTEKELDEISKTITLEEIYATN